MGGVPMLLLVAALGVDYGWQPDGGGGVEYVIQVQPDQWDNVKRLGEISSTIDPEVQGRVSRVIIRVGNERLPRVTPPLPRNTQTSSYNQFQPGTPTNARTNPSSTNPSNHVAAVDLTPVPIPEMADIRSMVPIPGGPGLAADYGASGTASMMKPDPASPQGGGFSLPESLQNVASGFAENSRGAIEQVQKNMGAGAPNQFAPNQAAPNQFDSAANQLRQQAAAPTSEIDQLSQSTRSSFAAQGPSTDPVSPSTNRVQPPPFTSAADPTGVLARARANGPSTDPAASRSAQWSPIEAAREAGAALSTAASGFGATGTFGREPESLRSNTNPSFAGAANAPSDNPFASPAPTSAAANALATEVDYRLTPAQKAALPPGAYSFNEKGIPVDRNWNPIDMSIYAASQTRSPSAYDPNAQAASGLGSQYPGATAYQSQTNYPAGSTAQNWNGSAISAIGQPMPAGSLTGNPTFASTQASVPATTYQGQTSYPSPGYSAAQPSESDIYAAAERIAREQLAADQRLAANTASTLQSNLSQSIDSNRNYRRDQDVYASSSDLALGSSGVAEGSSKNQASLAGKPTVAAQKLFNVMLLCSIVGNFYLFFWLKNMRDQFRDLVTAKRMSQSSVAA